MATLPCSCEECANVARIAGDIRYTASVPMVRAILLACSDCPRAIESYDSALALAGPRIITNRIGGKYPAPQGFFLPPFQPHYSDIMAWERADKRDLIRRLRERFTPDTRRRCATPFASRVRTDFGPTKHDYYLDDKLCAKEDGWKSASDFLHILFPEFDSIFISGRSARALVKRLLINHARVRLAGDRGSDVDAFWDVYVANGGLESEDNLRLFFEPFGKQFTCTPDSAKAIDDLFAKAVTYDFAGLGSALCDLLAAEIRLQWDDNRNEGSDKHAIYDKILQGVEELTDAEVALVPLGFLRCLAELSEHYDVANTEVTLLDEPHKIITQADVCFVHRITGECTTGDWKNCKDEDLAITAGRAERGCHVLTAHMDGSKLSKYSVQVSLYNDLLATEVYPGNMSKRGVIANFQPSNPLGYRLYWIDMQDMTAFREQALSLGVPKSH